MEKAVSLLTRAAELDKAQRFREALILYQEGIQMMIEAMKAVKAESDRQVIRGKIERWMRRAEKVKEFAAHERDSAAQHEQITIDDDAVGFDYERIFERVFKGKLPTAVAVEDAYIGKKHQVTNFLRFCELMVQQSVVKKITLKTKQDSDKEQEKSLKAVAASLAQHKVKFEFAFSDTLHDREISFDNGWTVKIGRGLDIYKPVDRYAIGFCDMKLRPCQRTTIDYILHSVPS